MQHLIKFLKEYWTIIVVLFSAFWFVTYLVIAGAWSVYGDNVVNKVKEELGITELYELIGANRLIRQPPGQTFVREPVNFCIRDCEPINMVFTFSRTNVGKECVYEDTTPIFVTENGSTYVGTYLGNGSQYSTDVVRREIQIERPDRLPVGRTSLRLQLEFTCKDETVFEMTDPAIFTVMVPTQRGN